MIKGFWNKLPQPFTVLAPMAEVTDIAFRRIVAECGRPDVFYTEFVSADGLCSAGKERLLKDLAFDPGEQPIVAQFFGAKPETFYESAKLARELGFAGVDINMGCPVGKVIKHGSGIGLCKTPELAKEIIAATKEGAGDLPVSVKTRLGYSKMEMEWIETLLQSDLAVLAVHLRTMKEMSKVPAHWEVMPQVVELGKKYGTPIIGNGDIQDLGKGRELAMATGAAGIMVGRGIFHNPWIFNDTIDPNSIRPQERLDTLERHTRYFTEFWGKQKSFNVLKRFYKIYVSGWDGAKDLRIALMEAKSAEEVAPIIAAARQALAI